ncbi:flagellar basal-body MS-ring/collar protein FliF [Yoonia sp. 208BN28-4]|uniref:flagellar basal-body MS-ring/collar protein FliF n=1 Tax=Yoonia sp. 208BN28-4 TaxID=3126505 RepID=UPI00309E781B
MKGEPELQNALAGWNALDNGRRMVALLAGAAIIAVVIFMVRSINQPDYALLFGGLEAGPAGDVIATLEQQGVPYDVRGGAIYVDSAQRDNLRLVLAREGLPASGGQGYELLDTLTGFGTTSQMFDAAYWRAKEGELARTIMASRQIRSARVHISAPIGRPFQRDQATTASVSLQASGGVLSAQQINAMQYLVAGAVSGLSPSDVAIIGDDGNLLSGDQGAAAQPGGSELAEVLRLRAQRILAARVGAGNALVEVSVDTVTDSEIISERIINPDSRVAISTDVQESTGKSEDSRGGDVTVASNLPDGDAGADAGSAQNENSETRSLTNYEISETQREIRRDPGAVKRLTVAVLVNELTETAADGTVTTVARDDPELEALTALVAAAVGIDEARGDEITLQSMAFEPVEGAPAAGILDAPPAYNVMQLAQIAALAIVALILGLFVVRPILTPKASVALPPPDVIEGAIAGSSTPISLQGPVSQQPGVAAAAIEDAEPADPVGRLRQKIAEREAETIQILQDWIEDPVTEERT